MIAILMIAAAGLGATVLREPIAQAAQLVDAKITAPLDGNGDVKVHEQGTAAVREQNVDPDGLIRVHEQGIPTVKLKAAADEPIIVDEVDTPTVKPFSWRSDAGPPLIDVPLGQTLVIEYVSGQCQKRDINDIAIVEDVGGPPNSVVHRIPGSARLEPDQDGTTGQVVRIYARGNTTVGVIVNPVGPPEPGFEKCVAQVSGHLEGGLRQIHPPALP
jgi:hypothetical protein